MWPDRVSNPGPLTYESGALPTALHGPAQRESNFEPVDQQISAAPTDSLARMRYM